MMDRYSLQSLVDVTPSLKITIEALTTFFACDYEKCKGACCWQKHPTEELTGGLVLPAEAAKILSIEELCSPHYVLFKHNGFYTTVLDENDVCVFCDMEKGCKLKHTIFEGIDIPVHCELFPLTFSYESLVGAGVIRFDRLFEKWCKPSFEKGEKSHITIIEFERRPLVRLFGEKIYEKLRTLSQKYLENGT